MTRILQAAVCVLFVAAIGAPLARAPAQVPDAMPLQLETRIPLGEVRGRIDHMTVDLPRQRVFVAELGNDSVSVVDLKESKVVHRLTGFKEPQGVHMCRRRTPSMWRTAATVRCGCSMRAIIPTLAGSNLGDDADNIRLDGTGQRLYVGYGSGALAVIDTVKKQKVGDIMLKAHPESFQLSPSTGQIFVNVPRSREIAVIDGPAGKQTGGWPMSQGGNFPMALNEAARQVLVVFRTPARLGVFGMADGRALRHARNLRRRR